MEFSTSQGLAVETQFDSIQFPIPRSSHSKPYGPISYFPPLKLEYSGGNCSDPLFPLILGQQITPKDSNDPGSSSIQNSPGNETTHNSVSINGRTEELQALRTPRNSWSYWIGGKSRKKKLCTGDQIPERDVTGGHPTAGTLSESVEPDLEFQLSTNSGPADPRFPQEYSQSSEPRYSQANKVKLSTPDSKKETNSPLPTSPAALVSPHNINKKYQPKTPLYKYRLFPTIDDTPSPYMVTSTSKKVSPQGKNTHSTKSRRRSYSLTMSSHPPSHSTQSCGTSEHPKRAPQGPGTVINGRKFHGVRSGPHWSGEQLQKRGLARCSYSPITPSKAFEKYLRLNGHPESDPCSPPYSRSQRYQAFQVPMLFTSSYQPLSGPGQDLHSNNSTNFSYPRTYMHPPGDKRFKTSSAGIPNSSEYHNRFDSAVSSGSQRSGMHSSHQTARHIAKSLSGGSRGATSSQNQLGIHSERTPNIEQTQVNVGVSRRSSLQPQSSYQPNSFPPDALIISPIGTYSYQNANELRNKMSPKNNDIPPSSSKTGFNSEAQNNNLETENNQEHITPKTTLSLEEASGGENFDNFEFTTVDAASGPYTPDHFVAEAGPSVTTTTRNPSKKSAENWESTGYIRRRSVGSISSAHTSSRSSNGQERSLLWKPNPPSVKPVTRQSWDAGAGGPSASVPAVVGLGITEAFREDKRLIKELENTAGHPYTATAHARPTRGSIIELDSTVLSRPDVYEPDASESRLNSLARKGRVKYETVAREIRQHIAAQNESKRAKRIDALSLPSTAKLANTSQSSKVRIKTKTTTEPQAAEADAVRIKSPTSKSGYIYISTVYQESQRIVEKIWERGIGDHFTNLKRKNTTTRHLRYGSAGKKVKVYMRGARSESPTVFERIGRKFGARKGRIPTETKDQVESDPFGIELCGAIDITEGRMGREDSDRWSERGFNREPLITTRKKFEEVELVDPMKSKLEGEGSKRYWSSRNEVEEGTTMWGRLRKMVTK